MNKRLNKNIWIFIAFLNLAAGLLNITIAVMLDIPASLGVGVISILVFFLSLYRAVRDR